MPRHQMTQSEYALQQVVKRFGNLLFALDEQCVTHTYRLVSRFCELKNINHLALWYLNTNELPFEEYSEKWLFPGEV